MRRREFIAGLGGAVAAWPLSLRAQQPGKLKRIGLLRDAPLPTKWIEGFRQGLRDLGHVEGQNITIEFGLARSVAELPDVAAELLSRKVDVLLASGSTALLVARNATSTIPVVFVGGADLVALGVAASLARPGGNITGMTAMQADLTGKRLQLLIELLPTLSTVAVLVQPANNPATAQFVQEAELAARTLGVQLQILAVRDPSELEGAFGAAQGAGAMLVTAGTRFTAQRTRIAELALKHRLPTIHGFGEMVEAGGLMSYGPDYADVYRRAATHVHKILQGTKPADIPVEQLTTFAVVLNMRTAKALGLTFPPALLIRATEVIE